MARIRYFVALWASKLVYVLLKLLHKKATMFPGQVALTLCPNYLALTKKSPKVICVTGTNGKTTTTNMIADILVKSGLKVVSNRYGSNINTGVATALTHSVSLFGKPKIDVLVLEVDERFSRLIFPYIKPDYVAVTNLFRDSLKRNAHPDYIFSVIDTYCPDTTKMILNADDLCSCNLKPNNEHIFYGIDKLPSDIKESINIIADYSLCPKCGAKLKYNYLRYHHIGNAYCPECGFKSFDADYLVTGIDSENKTFTVKHNGKQTVFPLISDILFNIYNQLTVVAVLSYTGMSDADIAKYLGEINVPDSRLNETTVNGVTVIQAMSKGQSAISSCRTFDFVSHSDGNKAVILAVDDYYDRKASIEFSGWIYDVDYEFMNNASVKRFVACGPRCYDHKVRLLLAGMPEEKIECFEEELNAVDNMSLEGIDKIYILYDTSTYVLSCEMKERIVRRLEGRK